MREGLKAWRRYRAWAPLIFGLWMTSDIPRLSAGAQEPATLSDPVSRDAALVAADNAAMDTMMSGMAVKSSGDPDADFAAAMIPHHQGAIDMAMAELRFGTNEQLRRIAQEIIVDQQQEIVAMRLAVGQTSPMTSPATAPIPAK